MTVRLSERVKPMKSERRTRTDERHFATTGFYSISFKGINDDDLRKAVKVVQNHEHRRLSSRMK